jgi:hypothetical protein
MPDSRLDELYREPPDRFIAARDQLAKDLRSAGEPDEAARVKRLRRPTVAAWIVNRAALEAAEEVEEFAAASRELADAQANAIGGDDDSVAAWRAAAAREREAITAVLEAADRLAREAGHAPSARAMELVEETLRAVSADAELRERVVAGRLEREQSAATLGMLGASPPPKPRRAPSKRQAVAVARRELERVERALADAERRQEELEGQVEYAEKALREAKERLREHRRRTAELERERKAAERRSA